MRHLLATALLSAVCAASAAAGDWIYLPSTYSNSPETGQRVTQYAPLPPVYAPQREDYVRSGFRQQRSTIRAGGTLDNYHIVDRWGEPIRPYGEWLYPNRPYAVPYDYWGPPFGGVNGEFEGESHYALSPGGRPLRRGGAGPRGGWPEGAGPRRGDWQHGRDFRRPLDAYDRSRSRINGLFDGQGIPGDDEHYRDPPRRLEVPDRDFFYRGRGR